MKFLRYIQKRRRAIFAMAALTIFSSPFTTHASNITPKGGKALTPTNNVYNIAVQKKLSDKIGVNKFTNFELDKGQIANMQFDKLQTLANLVDKKISINGTVNALRDGKIGGNLYFLSPEGIAVGASGVINAGSFTGMAVSKEYFENISKLDDATKFTNALDPENIQYNNDPKKGIDIQGVINAPGGISLYATKIDIGQNAILRTDVEGVDFKKVVNVEGADSGITGGLDAEYKDGDIIIKAYAEHTADASTLTTEEEVKKATENWEKITEREAVINVDGTIKSAGNVSINAESTVVFVENENFNAVTQTPVIGGLLKKANLDASLNYAKKTSKATVNIGKTADIFSAGDMDISATSTLNVAIETGTPAQGKSKKYIPATAVGVIVVDNQAVVNVEGKLESKGRMTINATANTNLNVDAKTRTNVEDKKDDSKNENSGDSDKNTDKDSDKKETNTDTDKNSDKKETNTDTDKNSSESEDAASNVNEDRFYVAVGVIAGNSKAEINIKDGSEIKVGAEDGKDESGNELKAFEANAIVENNLSVSAHAASKDKSTINTAVGVVAYNSDAIINVAGDITAEKGSINLTTSNTTTNSGNISNVLGSEVAPFENPFIIDPENEDNAGADSGNADTGKTDAGNTDAGNTDAGKTDAGKTDAGKTEEGKGEEGGESEDGGLADEAKKIGKQLLDTEEAKKFIEEAKSTGKELLEGLKTKLKELVKGKDGDKKDDENATVPNKVGGKTFTKILDGEYLKAGVAVGVISEKNTASVNIKNNAKITAKNEVAINSITDIPRQNISVESDVNNIKEEQKTASMVGLGVLATDIDNNADIVVDGNLTANNGDITIISDSGMKYDQFGVLVGDLKETLTKIKKSAKELGEEVQKEVGEKIDGYLKQLTEGTDDKKDSDSKGTDSKGSEDASKTSTDTSDATSQKAGSDDASTLKGNLSKLKENVNKIAESAKKDFNGIIEKVRNSQLKEDIGNLAGNLTAFVHPANYANYYVRSAFADSKDADDADAAKIDAAGSISIDTMRNNSRILIGKGNVKAENGSVAVDSTAKGGVVAITGQGGEFLTSSEASKKGAGISVIVGTFRNNAVVALGKSAINANDISIKTTDDSKHVNIIYGNGKADSTTITGMVSYINSPTNSIISIDDSAKLNAANDISLETVGKDYITSVNGGIAMGNGNGKSFGAALNILSNDKNVAVNIGDNGYLNEKFADNISAFDTKIKSLEDAIKTESSKTSPDADKIISDKTELKLLRINKRTQDILGENMFGSLDASAVNSDGVINAKNLTIKSDNGGTINSIAVAGTENSESHGFADGFNDKVYKGETFLNYADDSFKWLSTKLLDAFTIKDKDDKLEKSGEKKPADAGKEAGVEAGNETGDALNGAASNLGIDSGIDSQLNIANAGSAAININSGGTGSFISNANLKADTVNVSANDNTFKGAWAGAGAFNFFGDSDAAENTNVAIGGSVAYSDNSRNVDAIIKNSAINTTSIKNIVTRDDSDVAAGMGLAVSKSDEDAEGSNTNIAISSSINFINGDTHALLLNNTVKGGTIENKATLDALQVAGGFDIASSTSGEKGFSIGGSAAASKITNDLQSGIKGGSYENLGKVDITADKKSNQIDVAVAGGITKDAEDNGFAFGGGVAVSDINNNSRAFLSDTTKFQSSGVVNVDALDSKNSSSRNAYLSSRSINTDPTSYLNSKDKSKVNPDGGGNIVSVAFGGGAATGESASSGNAVSYASIANIVNVDINNNQAISAQNLNADSTNKSNIVNVSAGMAGATESFSAAGSAGVSDIKNNGTINIKNSNVTTTNDFLSSTESKAHIINVAGQTSLADSFAAGLTFAYNAMNNTTGINVSGGNWNVKNFGATSANDNYALAIGAGVTFSKDSSALNGSVGLNMGTNSTKSIIDGAIINGVNILNATATDRTSKTTVAGDLTLSNGGAVAAGGAVAYANIGRANNKEIINAQIANSTVSAKIINVEALDNAIMTTVGAGAGGNISDGLLTFQGAAAVSQVNKENIAEISNSTISNNADVNIIATSGGNGSDGLTLNDKNINVNNKINTAAGVIDLNFSKETWFDGVFAISVNKFNQSTQANLKNTSRPETVSNAGNVNIYSNSEADMLGVAVGGSGGQAKVSAAGSTSLNYINNSAKSLVENANVKATKNFGVVAQSDDKIANYAGTVNVDVDGLGAIGVSVAQNEITGNTDALINNSKLDVTGSNKNLIAISNPKNNLIDGYVTKNTWTSSGLFNGRTTENKSGLVVNSSATHSISSDLATIGIRATTDPGAGVSGTVNINKISGETNAKVENTNVAGNADTFVNAADYTNNGSFVGNAAASGMVAIGMLWNENNVDRKTNALVGGSDTSSKPTLDVKNLDVKADNRQGISNLNIAVGAGFSKELFAAASGDNVVRNQLEGTTTAKIENAIVNHSGAVDVNAYHKDNAFATNIAVGVAAAGGAGASATFDLGYGLMRENSTVNAEINNSTLTSKEKGAVKVNAENDSKIAGAFGTMGVSVHAGKGAAAAIALGINNNYVTNTVHAGIKGSTLDVGAVDVNAKNTSDVKADGGVAAVSLNFDLHTFLASLGSATAITNATFDNKVTADVNKSTINAAGDVNIQARDDHKSKETVVAAAASSGLAVSVNRMSTSINSGLGNLEEDQLGKTLSSSDLVMTSDNASKENANSDSDKLTGEFGSESRYLNEGNLNSLINGVRANSSATKKDISDTIQKRYKATVNYNNTLENGVFANVANESSIDAGENKISIGSTENNDLNITSGSGTGGIVAVGVGSTSIKVHRANTANVIDSSLKAKNIDISTTNGQTGSDGIYSKMYNATLTAVGASVGYNNVETNGTGKILISNAKITAAENLNAKAIDNSKSETYVLDAGLKGVGYTGVFAYNTNTAQTGIEVSNKSTLTANAINFNAENHTYRATDTLAISASGLGIQTNTSEAKDTSTNFINVTGEGNTFTGENLTFNALNGGQTYAHTNGQAYLGLNAVVAKGLANSNTKANISIDDANTFTNTTANITAQIGEDGKYTAESTGFAINGSAVGVNIDDMYAQTNSTAQVNIGNEIYSDETALNATALNKASRNAFMRNNAYSLVANANDISAYTIAKDNAIVTVGSRELENEENRELVNKVSALNITADTENKSYVAAKGTGGSIGGDFGSAAHADNSVNNTSEATLNGTWNIAGDLTLTANQHDSANISGYSARGAIFTGGKGSLDNVIKGSSTAQISGEANINAKTVNVNAKNYIKTDKYSDDYDYTLFGRMGGVVDDVDYQRSTATTNKSANINIGKNATITTTATQNYDALNDYDLKNDVYAEGGSLLASLRWVKSHNYITTDEKISVGTGATLKNEGGILEDGGITFAAHDNLNHNPSAKGYSQAGFGGYVRAEVLNDLTRNQTININGTLKSAKDLNLYAGADLNGEGSKIRSFSKAISQVQTLIPDGSADIIRKGMTTSNVNVNAGAYGQAVHDINIISNAGNEFFNEFTFYGTAYKSETNYKVATADNGNLTTADYKHSGNVKVNGELKAASTPDVTVNISGIALPDGFVLTNNKLKPLSYSVTSGKYTITEKSTDFAGKSSEEIFAQQIYNGITTETSNYADNFLKKRHDEVTKLLDDYLGNLTSYRKLMQDKATLEAEMIEKGMGSYKTKSDGTKEFVYAEKVDAQNMLDFILKKNRHESIEKSANNALAKYQKDSTRYTGLLQEKTSLEDEMIKLGMGSYTTRPDGSQEFLYGETPSIEIKSLILPDIEVSGGSINVVTGNLTGSGKLNASGVPKIDIQNKSSAYLITNRLTIADKGGAINYNDKGVSSNAAINDINVSKSGAAFSDMQISNSTQVPTINVKNSYAGQSSIPMKPDSSLEGYKDLSEEDKKDTYRYTPINYIEVTKDITNPVGKVILDNTQGSIRILSGANVNAQDIAMTAKESISQGYTEGLVNIANTPEYLYADEAAELRKTTGWDAKMPETNQDITKTSDTVLTGGTGRIAGDAIYIAARDININGLIQAGYNGYKATVTQKDVDNATETVLFNDTTMYKVNDGGSKLGKDGYYIYEPQIYYDKATQKLYVEDINSVGGKIYLTGRIMSTGNGKIVVADGAGNIDITNSSKYDMHVGKVVSSEGSGLIQIIDTAQDKLSQYSSGQTRTIKNYSAWQIDNTKGSVTTRDGLSIGQFVNYNPKIGMTYRWMEGVRQAVLHHYYKEEIKTRWGRGDDPNYKGNYEEMSLTASEYSDPEPLANDPLQNGMFMDNQSQTNNLIMSAKNESTTSYGVDKPAEQTKSGFFGCNHHWHHFWNKSVGSKQTYIFSLKGDYPISVGLIGETNPHINLTNASSRGGDLYLSGDIRNDINATLNIRANGGKIEQEEGINLSTNNIKLNAQSGIKNIDITNHRTDNLRLSAQTNLGDVDINVKGGVYNDKALAGNVVVSTLKSASGGVTLKAQGDIKQTISGTTVNAQNIKLESANGGINLRIESNGQTANVSAISAAAMGDIKLDKNDNADFRIGSIVSTNGDVELKAGGKFVDALDKVRDNAGDDDSELVKSWIDMGLIAGTDDYKGAYLNRLEKDRDNYKSDVTEQFSEYKTLLATYQSSVADYNSLKDEDKSGVTAPEKSDRLELLEKKFSKYETADAYLAADKDYQTLVETAKNPQYQWTEDELLAGIRSAIVNKEEGTASNITHLKDANITGKNVTLTGTGAGSNSKETTTIKMSELRVKANETDEEKSARLAKIGQLANVDAADVKVNYVLADGKPVMQTVTQVNYNYDADKGYYIDKAGNYIRYRNDADGNLLKYTYDKDLKQVGDAVAVAKDKSGNYDFSDVIKSTTTIENKEINSFEVSGTIPLGINATGNITVNTNGNDGVYIASRNKGVKIDETQNPNNNVYSPLNIVKIETTKANGNLADVRIIGEAGIFNAADSGANVVGKDLVLVGGNGAIGTQAKPFAVTLTGDLLSARANDEINLQKVGADNFRISAIYSPKAIRIANDENGIIEHSSRFDDIAEAYLNTPGEITLTGNAGTANNPILILPRKTTTLNLLPSPNSLLPNFYIRGVNDASKSITNGTINLNNISGNVDISSQGSIGQTQDGANSLTTIKVAAKGDVLLTGNNNKLSTVNIGEIGGDFTLKNDSDNLTANFGSTIGNSATINQTGDINLEGAINTKILNLSSEKGDIISTGGLKADKEINLSLGTFTHKGEIHTDKLTIATDNGVTINNTENTFNSLEISSRDGNAINGSIDVAIKADKFAPSIKNNVAGDVTLENTKKNGAFSFGDGEAISIDGTFTAITKGDFDYGSTLNAGKGISIKANNIYKRENTTGNFSTTGTILLNAKNNVGTAANPILVGNTANKSAGLDIFGKGIYVKGVNSGILTLGDVTGTSFNVNSEGAIAQADAKKINLTDKVEVSAAKNITLNSTDNVINKLTLTGGEGVEVYTTAPDGLTVDGTLKTTGDVTITSEKSMTLNGTIDTEKNITLTAGKTADKSSDVSGTEKIDVTKPGAQKPDTSPVYSITSSSNSALKAGNDITLKADDVKLSGKVETPYKEMTSDKIEDVKKFIEEMPVIVVTTNKGLDMRNKANSFEGLYVNSDGEQINGSVLVSGNSPGFLAVIDKAVLNDITLKNTKTNDGAILLLDKGILNSASGSITLEMSGDFGAAAALWANKDINITSRKSSMYIAKLSSLKSDGTLKADTESTGTLKADTESTGTLKADTESDDTLKADTESTDTLKATGNIKLKADKVIEIEGQVTAGRNLTADSNGITIVGKADVSAGENIDLAIDKGNLKIEGSVHANTGVVDIELGEGNVQIGNETTKKNDETVVFAEGDINISTGSGTINILGKNESALGSINIKAQNPDAENTSDNVPETYSSEVKPVSFVAHSDEIPAVEVNLFSANAAETNSAEVAPLAANAKSPNDITIDAELKANESIWIVTDEGNIEVTKNVTVHDGDITIRTDNGDIKINDNGADDMVRAQNNLNIETENGGITISGKVSTQDGDINITSNHNSYVAGQKGITVTETGAINPAKNVSLNATNGDIEFKKVAAQNANINSNTGDVTAETIKAADTIKIELERGNLYLNLAQSKGVAIVANDSTNSTVNTIQANSVDVNDAVKVGRIISYRDVPRSDSSGSTGVSGGSSSYSGNYSTGYSNNFSNAYSTGYSNFASNPSSFATLGSSTFTNNGLTYWQSATSSAVPDYSFSEFESANDMSYRQTRNYFEVKFIPTWLEKEFLSIDFDYSFDNFRIKNATEDELTID